MATTIPIPTPLIILTHTLIIPTLIITTTLIIPHTHTVIATMKMTTIASAMVTISRDCGPSSNTSSPGCLLFSLQHEQWSDDQIRKQTKFP